MGYMNKKPEEVRISRTAIDDFLWEVEKSLTGPYGTDTARADTEPLKWYIYTGRAGAERIRKLLTRDPEEVGRLLHMGGPWGEALNRVKPLM